MTKIANHYYITKMLTLQETTVLILKAQKMGFDILIDEMGAGTFLTFYESNQIQKGEQ